MAWDIEHMPIYDAEPVNETCIIILLKVVYVNHGRRRKSETSERRRRRRDKRKTVSVCFSGMVIIYHKSLATVNQKRIDYSIDLI